MGYRPRCGRYFAAWRWRLEILVRLFNKVKKGGIFPQIGK
jgi:hypothetical protein